MTAEGRRVGFRRYGADAPPALLYLHGCPGSRAEVRLYESELLEEHGICAIAVDRAGYGLTDPANDWDLLARVRDALAVADVVGMSTFAVQGTSAGGSYALALAATATDRVCTVILAGGQGKSTLTGHSTTCPPNSRRAGGRNSAIRRRLARDSRLKCSSSGMHRTSSVHGSI